MTPQTDAPAAPKKTPLALIFILITVALDTIGIGLLVPVLPTLLRDIGGVNLAEAAIWGGVLATSYAVMQFLFGPLMGALSDRFGRRPILLTTLAILSLDYLVMAVAGSLWLLLIARLIAGITAATQATATAFVADISAPQEKAARFGLIGAAFGLGFVVGPIIGGELFQLGGTRAPFYAAAAIAAANLIFGYFVLPETVTDRTRRAFDWRRANPVGAFNALKVYPNIAPYVLVFFLYQVAFMVYPVIWAYFTEAQFEWSPQMIARSLTAFGVALAIVQGAVIRLILARLKERGTVIYGLLFNAAAFLVLAFIESGTLALLFIPLTALGAVVTPALQGLMSRATPDDAQGELQGVISSAMALAAILSPMIMTLVFARFSRPEATPYLPGAPFLVSVLLMGLCLWVVVRSARASPA